MFNVGAMNTIIQHIETYWTKKSRGHPRATLRNAVPEVFPIENVPETQGVLLIKVKHSEYSNFNNPSVSGFRTINENQQRQLGFEFEELGGELLVSMWSRSGHLKRVGILKANSWLKIIANERTPIEYTWAYYKHVYNIYFGNACNIGNVLTSQQPITVLNLENNLW
ncbi:hypothetical protein [Pseudoalteromonas sp. Of7M-16]|uniref:hypothetical protein n=1 Tax=Pseudoalteromonas sp. Of7M-16 TaxID=2917756 RepID=UPI001EF6DF29|nr:hypothetical protein [Pseudoalteromonas sp. Of7M-16]MCG7550487.1 hypothetical protein [Pseudoalteromonas sp. Of7M-16]